METKPQGNQGMPRFGPSDALIAMFRACSRDPTRAIKERLRHMLHVFLQHNRANAWNRKCKELCCCQAEIWYYRILENLINQQRKRLGVSDVSGFLENNLVQCYLVTCCLEITICSNHLPCDFPLLLQIFNLASYHFARVIGLVLRAEVSLPCAVVRHLNQVHEKVLETLAWTRDSPLWEEIRENGGHLPSCQQVIPPTQLEDPRRTDFQPDENLPGVDISLGADLSTGAQQQCSHSATHRPRRSASLHLFTRKVYSLMGKRLRELCSILHVTDELRMKIWTCFEHSLVHFTRLMTERHLDQVLMCAIYIMAKISKMEIPFRHIMKCYKSQPQANKNVCKNVLISDRDVDSSAENNNNGDHSDSILTPSTPSTHYPGPCQEERGNLIYFYNQVYTIKMQHFAKQFAPTSAGDTPPLSPFPRQGKACPRGHRLSSCHSIFISPYNPKTTPPRTPGLCYYFNSSPSERLHEINTMITGRSPNKRCHVEEVGKDGAPSKKLRLDDQSAWQRRLRNVANERVTRKNRDKESPNTKLNQY